MKSFSLKNRAALVTGSSRGIGLAIGLGLREAGAKVVFHGTSRRSSDIPKGSAYVKSDLLLADSAKQLFRAVVKVQPKLDLLVCNAGSFFDVPFLEMTQDLWDRTMQLNVKSSYFLVQQFARHLVAQQRTGAVVIVSSTNGTQAEADSTAYDTSKGALIMMTKSLAASLADSGIRVNGLAPGLIRTPLTERWLDVRTDLRAHYDKKILLGHVGAAEDCAGAAVFLCSDAACYITGHILTVDGGLTVSQIGKL
ncbi:MAG: short-chain dehydrogenase [Verrucomicrobiales bacterium]|nr:short-chain dehydrogenase [Verrucomicrobiales bacterium]